MAEYGQAALQLRPNIHWIGTPVRVEPGAVHYRNASIKNLQITIGDDVYLQPADRTIPLYIARIKDLVHLNLPSPQPTLPPDSSGQGMVATVAWYYRPQELDLSAPLPVYDNEVFQGSPEEEATHPLDSVAGICVVCHPSEAGPRPHAPNLFVCSRKYIPTEGRVVPLNDAPEEEPNGRERPFSLVNGRLLKRPASRRAATTPTLPAPTASDAAAGPTPQPSAVARQLSGRKRRTRSPPPQQAVHARSPTATSSLEGVSAAGGGAAAAAVAAASTPRTPHGRWSRERYATAHRSLVQVLRAMGAVSPEKSVLRATLRDEARKVIGDTGLLDHLLKHLADQMVTPEGERLRRRHNREGHMEYWLQNPAVAEQEEAQLQEEVAAFSSELREVREARHVLQAVRTEAAQAIQAVSELKERPQEAVVSPAGVTSQLLAGVAWAQQGGTTAGELGARVEALDKSCSDLARRLHDAEALAAAGIEDLRSDSAAAGRLLGEHIASFNRAIEELSHRCDGLERRAAVEKEDAAGRFEAVSAALRQLIAATTQIRYGLVRRDEASAALRSTAAPQAAPPLLAGATSPPAWATAPPQATMRYPGGPQHHSTSPTPTSAAVPGLAMHAMGAGISPTVLPPVSATPMPGVVMGVPRQAAGQPTGPARAASRQQQPHVASGGLADGEELGARNVDFQLW